MILHELKERFRKVLAVLTDNPDEYLDLLHVCQDARFGDYQANMAMPLGKKLKKPPRQIAEKIVVNLDWNDFLEQPEIAGPGFINLRIRPDWLVLRAQKELVSDMPGHHPCTKPLTYIIDFSAPNVAKPLHVGHLRSTVLGNALRNILVWCGHRVIGDNHLGDWGTQFGMIIYGYRNFLDQENWARDPIEELGRLYRLVRQLIDFHAGKREIPPELEELARCHKDIGQEVLQETSKLHHGDPDNIALWKKFVPVCIKDIDRIYDRLGVVFDISLGESFYNDQLPGLTEDLKVRGIARPTEGAIGIFFDDSEVPMLIQKKDGAYLYATTDIATLKYRQKTYNPDYILYVVDSRQSLHFEQLFRVAHMLDMKMNLQHIKFGSILGDDGKPFKTRSGDTVGLNSLLDEAVGRALKIVCENDDAKNPEDRLSKEEREDTARKIGIGALIYADLSQNRESDYVFSYDRMLAMNGNTATYMQYACARIRSIFTKGNIDRNALKAEIETAEQNGNTLLNPVKKEEKALLLELIRFSDVLDSVIRDYRPNLLTGYLFDLANKYSSFFEQCPVLKAEDEETRKSRLLLCDLTEKTISKGLQLLGIQTVERM